jgi:SAM-dependent methyltransferase
VIRVDLGCGDLKDPGFIGVDLRPGPQVDVVADMDFALPFRDDSVDLLFASHALEHVQDLPRTMREIYRVCRHGARVCIVAPYYEQKINFANPYHKVAFNEHTPRFWTAHPTSGVPEAEYWHPHAGAWGLSRSDRSDPGIDFRCERIEYFYFPEYRSLPEDERRLLRKQRLDVCDQIVINLYVVKPADGGSPALPEAPLPEPSHVTIRRLKEELEEARSALAAEAAETARLRQEMETIRTLREELGRQRTAELDEHQRQRATDREEFERQRTAELDEHQRQRATDREEFERQRAADREELDRERTRDLAELQLRQERALLEVVRDYSVRLERASEEARARCGASVSALGSSLEERQREIARARLAIGGMREAAMRTAGQLDLLLRSRLVALYRRFFWGHDDLWPHLSPAFLPLKQSLLARELHARGFRLALGPNLQIVPFREYPLQAPFGGPATISVALIVDVPGGSGEIGVEIVSPDERIVAHVQIPLAATSADCLRSIAVPEIAVGQERGWRVRLFARDSDSPVRPVEFQKRRWLGLRRPHLRGFYAS